MCRHDVYKFDVYDVCSFYKCAAPFGHLVFDHFPCTQQMGKFKEKKIEKEKR